MLYNNLNFDEERIMVIKYLKNIWFWVIALPVLYLLSGFVLLPWLVQNKAPSILKEHFNLAVSLENFSFNPLTYELHIDNLSLFSASNERVIGIKTLYIDYSPLALLKKEVVVKSFLIHEPFINLQIDHNGTLNLLTLFASFLDDSSTPESNVTETKPIPLVIEHFELNSTKGTFTDFRPLTPFVFEFGPMNYTVNNINFKKDDLSIHALHLLLDNQEKITLASSLSFDPFIIHGEVNVSHFPLPLLWNYLLPTLPAKLKEGELSARLPFTINLSKDEPEIGMEKATLSLEKLLFHDTKEQKFLLAPLVKAEGISLHWPENRLLVESLNLNEPFVSLVLEKNYATNLATLFTPTTHTVDVNDTSSTPWNISLQKLHLEKGIVEILDKNVLNGKTALSELNLEATNLSTDTNQSIRYALSSRVDKNSRIALDGSFHLASNTLETSLSAQALPLIKAQPYLAPYVTFALTNGTLSTQSTLKLSLKQTIELFFKGDIHIDALNINDVSKKSLLAWDKLSLLEVMYATHPSSLHVTKILLNKPYLNLDIKKDKSTNFSGLLKPTPPKKPASKPSQQKEEEMQMRIGEATLKGGSARFKDASLPIPFATLIHNLNGSFSTLDTKNTRPSVLSLEGKVDKYGYAKINGSLLPFDFTNRANLKLLFKNIDMPSLTPYSGKFIGYAIQKGKLSLDLSYKIKQGLMEGDNKINLDSLTLGEKIESKEATSLPLGLAIAILKDSKGQIDLNLPVSGDLNDPEFRYGAIVWKAIGNLIGSVVTSPFSLLGSILGIETESLQSVDFALGSFELIASEEEKMEQYRQILEKKPELKLRITPTYNEEADGTALRENKLAQQIEAMTKNAKPGENSYAKALKELFIKHLSKEAYEALMKTLEEQKADRGVVNETLKGMIVAKLPLAPEELQRLARQRAETFVQKMTQQHKIPAYKILKNDIQPGDTIREKWIGCAITISN